MTSTYSDLRNSWIGLITQRPWVQIPPPQYPQKTYPGTSLSNSFLNGLTLVCVDTPDSVFLILCVRLVKWWRLLARFVARNAPLHMGYTSR